MKKILKVLYVFFQVAFYLSVALAMMAGIYWFFGDYDFKNVLLWSSLAIAFLLLYYALYRIYDGKYKVEAYKTIPEHLDDLNKTIKNGE